MNRKAAVAERPANGAMSTDVAARRREQILDAAVEIIATQGIHRLSLGNIEKRAKMARGHLTYYFPAKEDILLAVFDRMLTQMIENVHREVASTGGPRPGTGHAWEFTQQALAAQFEPKRKRDEAFLSLVHTFRAQTIFREDFRQKIATANEGWRNMIAADYSTSVADPPASPRTVASIIMALLIGLQEQYAVDSEAFESREMLATLLKMLAPLFHKTPPGEAR